MLVRAAGTGFNPHTAVVNESIETGLLRLITSMANTARCFGAPNGIRAPSAVITNGPKTPNPRPMFRTALPASRGYRRPQLPFLSKTREEGRNRRCGVAYDRPSCPPTVVSDRSGPRG